MADASDAFTDVKPYIKKYDGRAYIIFFRRTIETLQYINKRAITFEKFVSKLFQGVDELEKTI